MSQHKLRISVFFHFQMHFWGAISSPVLVLPEHKLGRGWVTLIRSELVTRDSDLTVLPMQGYVQFQKLRPCVFRGFWVICQLPRSSGVCAEEPCVGQEMGR